mgnify:CR=1 FL=1
MSGCCITQPTMENLEVEQNVCNCLLASSVFHDHRRSFCGLNMRNSTMSHPDNKIEVHILISIACPEFPG